MVDFFYEDVKRYYKLRGQADFSVPSWGILLFAFIPRLSPVFLIRLARFFYERQIPVFPKVISLINFIVFGIEVGQQVEIGPGLVLPHTSGTVIGARKIGRNVTIYQNVTLGALDLDFVFDPLKRPVLGDNVVIASGAKVLGGIEVGPNSVVAANAVLVKSAPENVVVGGVPAIILKERSL